MKKPKKSNKQKPAGKKNKKKYKIRNWKEYNEALVNRGRITFWICDDAIAKWKEKERTGKPGKPKTYSDTAIETALALKEVFHLPLRATEGFLGSILEKLDAPVDTPDYSTLSIRGKTLEVSIRVRPVEDGIHLVVDSTGVKVYGEGEWKVRQHGWSKHRRWKKLHIGVDESTGDIILGTVTGNETADCEVFLSLLDQAPDTVFGQVSGDGSYDKEICYDTLRKRDVPRVSIPPQHNARIRKHGNCSAPPHPRDTNLRRIRSIGRKQWKIESGYHRRSLAETAMFRLKTVFSDKVRARTEENQQAELLIRCKALNRMTMLGMPDSYGVA